MGRFEFRFETLLKLRYADRRQRRMELAQALQAEWILDRQIAELAAEEMETRNRCCAAAGPGRVDVDELLDIHRYTAILKARAELLRDQQARLRAEIDRRRQILVEADRQARLLEKLKERQLEQHRADESRREVKELDEIAQRTSVRGN
jgi:flagellar FliJ protein